MILDTFLYLDTYHDTCIIDTPQHCILCQTGLSRHL